MEWGTRNSQAKSGVSILIKNKCKKQNLTTEISQLKCYKNNSSQHLSKKSSLVQRIHAINDDSAAKDKHVTFKD
jgi:hypothetical protein